MIQRIQSVFLFVIVICASLMFFIPVEVFSSVKESFGYALLPLGLREGTSPIIYGLFAANVGIFAAALVCVFQFKNRKKQLKTSRMLIVLAGIETGLLFAFSLYGNEGFQKTYTWAAYLPIAIIVLALLAGVFIKKDEELVRSADRIR